MELGTLLIRLLFAVLWTASPEVSVSPESGRTLSCLSERVRAAILLPAITTVASDVEPQESKSAHDRDQGKTHEWLDAIEHSLGNVVKITGYVVFCGLIAAVLRVAIKELGRQAVLIDPIQAPKDLIEQGYTPTALAQRIATSLMRIQRDARLHASMEAGFELSTDQVDFTVPSTGVSYRTMLRLLRQTVHGPEKRVQGELVRQTNSRTNSLDQVGPANPTMTLVLRVDGRQAPWFYDGKRPEDNLTQFLDNIASEVASLVNPYLFANYCFRVAEGTPLTEEGNDRRFDKTLKAVEACFEQTPAKEHYRAYLTWGNALLIQRKFDEAEEKFRSAAEIRPRFAPIYNSWGILERRKRRFDAAARYLAKAIRLDEGYALAWSNLALICNDRSKYREAKWRSERALKLDPGFAMSWTALGLALCGLGKDEKGRENFARAIHLDPRSGWAYLHWASSSLRQGRFDEAIDKARAAAEKTSTSAQGYALCGDILVRKEECAEAEKLYRQAASADKSIVDGLVGLASLRNKERKYDQAIRLCEEAHAKDCYHPGALLQWANALRLSGLLNEATTKYKELIGLDCYQVEGYAGWGHTLLDQRKFLGAFSKFVRALCIDRRNRCARSGCCTVLREMRRPKIRSVR